MLPYSLSVLAKRKGGKVVELCLSFGKQRGECKTNFLKLSFKSERFLNVKMKSLM